jgi:hypothetical protein
MKNLVNGQHKVTRAQTKEVKNEARMAADLTNTKMGYSAGEGVGMFLCVIFLCVVIVGYVCGFVYVFTHLPH